MKTKILVLLLILLLGGMSFQPSAMAKENSSVKSSNHDAVWDFKKEFLPLLINGIPALLHSQDPKTGRFGKGIWIVTDQNAIYPLAAAWSLQSSQNPYYHDPKVLNAIMDGGDALIEAQDAKGEWVFRKKDGSTWGNIYMPWTYSRWVRAYSLIKDAMPNERRERWIKGLTLGFTGIADILSSGLKNKGAVANIPTHDAMALYCAGQALNRPQWCSVAREYMAYAVGAQNPGGYWTEGTAGPLIGYNFVYVDAVGTYYALSGDASVLPALQRAAQYHATFTYPDGTAVYTIAGRQPYHHGILMPNVGFSFSAAGRGYLSHQWDLIKKDQLQKGKPVAMSADLAASFLLYGAVGAETPTPAQQAQYQFILDTNKAMVRRQGAWFVALSAYHSPISTSRWHKDRQNFLSLFNDKAGLLIGGGNTKLHPLWSTFTVGNPTLMESQWGKEKPNFIPPAGLQYTPDDIHLHPQQLALDLKYGKTNTQVRVELMDDHKARLTYSVQTLDNLPVAAHITLLPRVGEKWSTASGKSGVFGDDKIDLKAGAAGEWFGGEGWKIHLPPQASITWPVMDYNSYVKDGHSSTLRARTVISLPFERDRLQQQVIVDVP